MKLQDLLRHIADNVENGKGWYKGLECKNLSNRPNWEDVVDHHDWFKLAPRTHVVNGFTVPAPEVEAPQDEYFIANIGAVEFHHSSYWANHDLDSRRLKRGLIHLKKEAAIANAKAMLGINPDKD